MASVLDRPTWYPLRIDPRRAKARILSSTSVQIVGLDGAPYQTTLQAPALYANGSTLLTPGTNWTLDAVTGLVTISGDWAHGPITAAPRTVDSLHLQLTRADGTDTNAANAPSLASLYRTDWQGTVQLSPSPRTNYMLQSEDMTTWGNNVGTPLKTALTLQDTSMTTIESAYKFVTVPNDSNTYVVSVLVGKNAGNIVQIGVDFGGGTAVTKRLLFLDTATGAFKFYDANIAFLSGALVDDLGASGWAVSIPVANNGAGNTTMRLFATPAVAASLGAVGQAVSSDATRMGTASFTKWMAVPNVTGRTSYIPTTTAPVTLTDYTMTSAGAITLAQSGGTYDGTWSYVGGLETGDYIDAEFPSMLRRL